MTSTLSLMPSNDYDIEAWTAYWAINPHLRRSLSAAAADENASGENASEDTKDETGDDVNEDKPEKPARKTEKKAEKAEAGVSSAELAKLKKERDDAQKRAAEAADLVKRYEGIDPDKARKMLADAERAEEEARLARGEFEAVKKQMIERHEAEKKSLAEEVERLKSSVMSAQSTIEELTVGVSFSTSKFISDKTVFTPKKARAIFGAHFDVVDGRVVGYDKPRGSDGRSPIVDGNGNPASFDEAIQKIVESDEDRDRILKATVTSGADSKPAKGKAQDDPSSSQVRGLGKITAALQKNRK